MINSKMLKQISKRLHDGNADKSDIRIYNYYVSSWGI